MIEKNTYIIHVDRVQYDTIDIEKIKFELPMSMIYIYIEFISYFRWILY